MTQQPNPYNQIAPQAPQQPMHAAPPAHAPAPAPYPAPAQPAYAQPPAYPAQNAHMPAQPAYAAQPAQPQYAYAPAAPTAYQAAGPDMSKEGGDTAIPAISITAFCERSQTAGVIHETTHDWRMKRVNLNIFMGGLPAAIDYYQNQDTPSLIMIESGLRGAELFMQLEQLASVCGPDTQVIIIGAANDIYLYRQLIEKGVSDYIVPPFHPLNIIRSIASLYADPEQPFSGRVAAFFGAKGGVGSSTMAHNVAWCLSETIGQETALIDLDMSWGTTGLDFAYDSSEGLEEALANPERLDETLLDRIMVRHTPRLSILPAPASLVHKPVSSTEAFEKVVEGVRKISSMSILDMPHYWSDWTEQVLSSADDIVITATPDLANLRNTKNLIDHLRAKRPNDAEPLLILNMAGRSKRNEISIKDFSSAVSLEPALVVGFDPDTFFQAANDGKMLSDIKSAGQIVSGLNYLASRIKTGKFGSAAVAPDGKAKGKSLLSKGRKDKSAGKEQSEKKSILASLPFGK